MLSQVLHYFVGVSCHLIAQDEVKRNITAINQQHTSSGKNLSFDFILHNLMITDADEVMKNLTEQFGAIACTDKTGYGGGVTGGGNKSGTTHTDNQSI